MKPRLDSSELTLDDSIVWFKFLDRLRPLAISDRIWWKHQCRYADRRDADLMLQLGTDWQDRAAWERGYPGVIHTAWAFQGLGGAALVPDCRCFT